MCRSHAALGLLFMVALAAAPALAQPTGAEWELQALGVPVGERRDAVSEISGRRAVTMAIVGQGGVSKSLLEPVLGEQVSVEYRDGATDPGTNTHDTQAARVILDLTSRLGVQVKLLVYQPGAPFSEVAAAMTHASGEADMVAFFQSFWGPASADITESIRGAEGCLFVSPYVEYNSLPTSTCPQGYSAKPWADGLANFVTAAPVAFKAPGKVLDPADRENDTEVINFLAPSYYASGAGGTCPAGEVTAAVAAYTIASVEAELSPAEIVAIMREGVTMDEAALGEALAYDAATVQQFRTRVIELGSPAAGRRRLDAIGLLNLWGIYQEITGTQ